MDKCAELGFSFKPRTRHLVVGALAGAGFAYQTTGIGPGLPFFVRWPLLPFRASEACLSSLAYGIRAADARAALPACLRTNARAPLHRCAAAPGGAQCARLLLEAGAPIAMRDRAEQSAVHFCARSGDAETMKVLTSA